MSDAVEHILETVAAAAPAVRAGLADRREYLEGENPSGEARLAADVHADRLLEERLLGLENVVAYASEERDEVAGPGGDGLRVAVDPLDGSSNLESNNPMGTIVGVYDAPFPARGRDLVGAGFVLYGPITTMVAAVDGTAAEYVLEPREPEGGDGEHVGVRRAVDEPLELPADPVVYGFGGRVPDWTPAFTGYARGIESELKLRYGGALIADVSQVLTYGGVFAYPALDSRPEGKLRLQFEGNPVGYIVEAAGGRSSDGERSLLDVEATDLHQRVPVHVGNADLIERLEAALA